jgi:hypothetical protein
VLSPARKRVILPTGRGFHSEELFEKGDRLEKGTLPNDHDEVDGVEVFLTSKAPGEIGPRVGGGVEVVAEGTEESEIPFLDACRQVEVKTDEVKDGYLVPQAA